MNIKIALMVLSIAACSACSPMVYTHGVPNLAQVESNVWRSGQITTQEGWDHIAKLAAGRKVHVIKLNFDHEGSDELAVKMGFDVHVLAVQPEGDQDWWDDIKSVFRGPDPKLIDEAEKILGEASSRTATDFYLGHCTHGQDRTGYLFGVHRVLHDGWSKETAYAEMIAHRFHPELHGVHEAWESFKPPSGRAPTSYPSRGSCTRLATRRRVACLHDRAPPASTHWQARLERGRSSLHAR